MAKVLKSMQSKIKTILLVNIFLSYSKLSKYVKKK